MMASDTATAYADIQREALFEEMNVSDFWGRISRDDDPTMADIADSPMERQAYANIENDLKNLNLGSLMWVGGLGLASLLALFGVFSQWLLVTLIGLGSALFLMGVAAYSGLVQKVFPAADALYSDSLQLGLYEAVRFPETYYDGMWESVREQVEEIKTWVPIAGIALVASLTIISAFANGNLNLEQTVPDGLIAVLSVLAAFLCLYAIAGYITALDRLKRGARIIGRLVGQGKANVSLTEMEDLHIPEREDHTQEFEAIQAAEEEPEEDEEPMSEEKEIVYEDEPRSRPRVNYREPRAPSNRPLIIQKREPVYPQMTPYPQPYLTPLPNTYVYTGIQAQPQPMSLQVSPDRNAQMLMTTQIPYAYPYPVPAPVQPPQTQEPVPNDELYRALTYRLHDLQSRLAWMRDRLETLEETPAPQAAAPQPAVAGAPASASTQVHVTGGGPLADLERERLIQQIRHLEEESRAAREEQMTLVERIRTLQREGLANQGVRADLEAAQREKERLIARQKRLEGESEKVRNDYEDALNKLSKQEREHQLAMQRLLERMQTAETDKERIAMEYEQLMRQLQAMPGPGEMVDVGQYHALQQALEEKQKAFQEAQGQVDDLQTQLEELANREIPETGAPLDEYAALQETLAEREAALEELRLKLQEMDQRPVRESILEDYEDLQQTLAEKEGALVQLREKLQDMEQRPEPETPTTELATGLLERTGLDYQAYITLRDKFILDEVGRLTTSPLSRILDTKELDNTAVAILSDLELTFHTVTAVRKKKSQYKDFYRKPRIEELTKLLDSKLRSMEELENDPSMRASLIEYGVNRPFYNSLIESVILDGCPPGSHLKVSRPSQETLQRLRRKLELEGMVREALDNPLQMVTAPPNSKEDAFFDIFYLLPKATKKEVKSALLEAYISSRYQAVKIPLKNLKLWYAGFYVEPERMEEVRQVVRSTAEGLSTLPEAEPETVTTMVGASQK